MTKPIITNDHSDVDVIISWPKSMDYPAWRDFIVAHKHYFNRIFIVFTETNKGIDYSDFVQSSLDDSQFCFIYPDKVAPGQDWRDQAVNMALDESKASWVWFTEQDLLITSPSFWPIIRLGLLKYDVIGYKDGATRLHPSNLWVKREWIEKTGRDFGIVPDKLDHFARFWTQLRLSGPRIKLLKQQHEGGHFYHMNGLSHNLTLIQDGQKPIYKEDEFRDYLMLTLQSQPLDSRYKKMCEDYLNESAN